MPFGSRLCTNAHRQLARRTGSSIPLPIFIPDFRLPISASQFHLHHHRLHASSVSPCDHRLCNYFNCLVSTLRYYHHSAYQRFFIQFFTIFSPLKYNLGAAAAWKVCMHFFDLHNSLELSTCPRQNPTLGFTFWIIPPNWVMLIDEDEEMGRFVNGGETVAQ